MNNDVKKVLNFEIRKFIINKPIFISCITIFLVTLFIICLSFFLYRTTNSNASNIGGETRLNDYGEEIEEIQNKLKDPYMPLEQRRFYSERIEKLQFFMDNKIVEGELIEFESNTLFKKRNYYLTSFMYYVFTLMYIPLILFALLNSFFVFNDVSRGMIKNLIASGIEKKNVFKGKVLFQFLSNLTLVSIVFVFTFLVGVFEIKSNMIVKINGNYAIINSCLFYLIQVCGELLILCVLSIFLDFIVIIFKNVLYSCSFLVALYAFNFLLSSLIQKYIDISASTNLISSDQCLPFLNIKYYLENLQYFSVAIIIIHIILSVFLVKINEFLFKKSF